MSIDLRTDYLGLHLRSPLVASASPMTGDVAMARRLEDAGVGAIVLPSLFEEEILNEEIELNRSLETGTETFAEALDYFPEVDGFADAGERYLRRLEAIRHQASVPVIASLNATSASTPLRPAAGSPTPGGSPTPAPMASSSTSTVWPRIPPVVRPPWRRRTWPSSLRSGQR